MNIYENTRVILSSDVTKERHLRLSALFRMMQEAAIIHTTALGMGREKTMDKGLLWVITLQHAWIDRLPEYDETVTLQSWPGRTMHMYFPRYYRMLSADGTKLLEASVIWGLMDEAQRHLVFPEEYGIEIPACEDMPSLPMPRRPVLPDLQDDGMFVVPYSYTDLNSHMNNTHYFDLAQDRMRVELRDKNISEIRAEFDSEALEGQQILLFTTETGSSYYMGGRRPDGKNCFRIMMQYR